MKIIAFTGMPGAGKSLAAEFFKNKGIPILRLGDLTEEEIKNRGLEITEENESLVRKQLRKEFGMDIYAKKVSERVDKLEESLVVLDGVKSFEEYLFLKNKYGQDFVNVSLLASPKTRQERLMNREVRPLNAEEFKGRDKEEIEELNHGSTIAMGDYYIVNGNISKEQLREKLDELLKTVGE